MKTQREILDLQFIEMRHLVVEIAAFLDRLDRHPEPGDFRKDAILEAIRVLAGTDAARARAVLELFSDHSVDPVDGHSGAPACGAPNPS